MKIKIDKKKIKKIKDDVKKFVFIKVIQLVIITDLITPKTTRK